MTTAPTGLRAAILARCDELERLARAAARWKLTADRERWRDGVGVTWERPAFVLLEGEQASPPAWETNCTGTTPIPHVAIWDPSAVLALVVGAREMCNIHQPHEHDEYQCTGCGLDRTGEAMNTPDECPTLAALARMLGVVEVREGGP